MLNAGSIFTLLLGNTHYQGPVPDDLGCRHFYATLRMDTPKEVRRLSGAGVTRMVQKQDRLLMNE
jgi:hypothetical protein